MKGIVSLMAGGRVNSSTGCGEAGAHIWIRELVSDVSKGREAQVFLDAKYEVLFDVEGPDAC